MAKEFFTHPETQQLFDTVEEITRRSGVSRGQAFEDVLRASVAALAAETMEPEYFDAIKAHLDGKKGKRGVDLFPVFLAQAVDGMSRNDNDVLGDLFQAGISYGEHGLYLTPQLVAELMARLSLDAEERTSDGETPMICDPCCGSGLLLMEAGKINPQAELIGQDIDARCARITALNLGLRGKYGWVICGNSLSREVQFVYRIGSFFHESCDGLSSATSCQSSARFSRRSRVRPGKNCSSNSMIRRKEPLRRRPHCPISSRFQNGPSGSNSD